MRTMRTMRTAALLSLFLALPLGANAQRCSDFRTCEEAMESFRNGNTKLDRDRDGIPCESLCSGSGGGSKGKPTKRSSVQPQQRLSSPPRPSPVAKVPVPRQPATLASVGDGDTIRVSTRSGQRLTIRLACIDAPEMAQGLAGQDARAALAEMVKSGPLEIKTQTTDKYGRTVAEVFVGGKNVNLALVRGGHAFAYRKYLSQCDQASYLGAEAWAQQYGQGVWRYGTERPWEFRQRRREK